MRKHAGHLGAKTVRAFVAVRGSNVVGIAGVLYSHGLTPVLFSWADRTAMSTRDVVLGARYFLSQGLTFPAVALAEPNIAGSKRFLVKLGFRHLASMSEGEVYAWPGQQ